MGRVERVERGVLTSVPALVDNQTSSRAGVGAAVETFSPGWTGRGRRPRRQRWRGRRQRRRRRNSPRHRKGDQFGPKRCCTVASALRRSRVLGRAFHGGRGGAEGCWHGNVGGHLAVKGGGVSIVVGGDTCPRVDHVVLIVYNRRRRRAWVLPLAQAILVRRRPTSVGVVVSKLGELVGREEGVQGGSSRTCP